ncbi:MULTISPECIES: aspartate--tRNA ligase [unclassified Paracoccus (in: a-proteobacteria)]|uniref:aspartate--tRNA ligase n=1 Tax=unclassified Paracoccus (in: a-proteobacteria) TaxID=2688777 RepID=UPI0012B28A23|nr:MULTISPECIES: aspartate--tRNA ligase [unclassified Paracoccus (in: a-proteobacteria)]UXU75153.1 aspartate--tRNA ligase [Paracoccus sp. SMMA_5]UXU81055.1 aspartate--tRNA ligase [Paracoccus sp. SMMA_5_TC]
MSAYRSHTCGELTAAAAGSEVRLSGWVHRVRDHGGVLFIDLRDHYGITQVIADGDSPAFPALERLRAETVIRIDGKVKLRDPSLVNPKLPTGEIEVYATDTEVLGPSDDLPLPVFGDQDYPEETRLTYRFLDLRRESLHNNIMLRSRVIRSIRNRMWDAGFTEFQTPIITASSPEGARDFLVPSRLHPGKFYALPQAPQQFKQLIMVAGFDKYFQIAPCFRDEDPRADRSPTDFYQLDLEMSFVEQEDVFATVQPVIQGLFEEFGGGRPVDADWPRIPYAEAMLKYGSDKPDLRNPIEMQDVSEHFRGSGFAIFAKLLEQDGNQVRAIPAPTGGSRKFADRMNAFAQAQGLPGMGYIFWRKGDDGSTEAAGPIAKALGHDKTEAIRQQLGLGEGDAVFFLGGKPETFEAVAGRARNEIGRELGLTVENQFKFAWIVDFPMYEKGEDGKIDFSHNPFSMPQGGLEALETQNPLDIKGYQYDLACNGYELISGAIRNHRPDVMFKAFELAGYGRDEVEKRFGGMVKAFRYGAPPHGGCAAGIDRIVMLLADEVNIREVIMFPMNQRAEDLMMGAPSEPTNEQLRDLRLRVLPRD